MAAFLKAKISFAFLLGSALFAATDAHAMKVSEANKLSLQEQGNYVVSVINAHLDTVALKDVELAKKTQIYMYSPSKTGIYQGVAEVFAFLEYVTKQGKADQYRVEDMAVVVFNRAFQKNNFQHEGKPANMTQFVPPGGINVAYNPPKKDEGSKNIASAPAKPDDAPVKNGAAPLVAKSKP